MDRYNVLMGDDYKYVDFYLEVSTMLGLYMALLLQLPRDGMSCKQWEYVPWCISAVNLEVSFMPSDHISSFMPSDHIS
jgi:hypothetical protein